MWIGYNFHSEIFYRQTGVSIPLLIQQFTVFAHHHYLLVGAFVIISILLVADTIERKRRQYQELDSQGVALSANRGASILDLRDRQAFESGHIAHAIRADEKDISSRIQELAGRSSLVILCCENGERSSKLAKQLAGKASVPLAILKNGLAQWQRDHFPVIRGREGKTG
jgi:rhodanese-related sulfurtransferase